jgi:hypothetical protein
MSEHPILSEHPMRSEYPIRIGRRSRLFLRFFFGVRPGHDLVRLEDGMIEIRFGWFSPRFPVSQVVRWRIEGPWLWVTAIGVRLSLRHRDLSFAGSPRGGVRMDLEPQYRYGPLSIPAFYVGVEDLDGFAAELAALGIPGEDARTG